MTGKEYELVARIGKARGLEGEVTAVAAGNLPFSVYPGLNVHVVPPSLRGKRELVVTSVVEERSGAYRLRFEGVDTIDEAEQVAGRFLLAERDDLEPVDDGTQDIGRMLVDARHGELGRIKEVIRTAAHDVWVVDGGYGEVLVPVIDEVIDDLPSDEDEPIRVTVMDGLIGS